MADLDIVPPALPGQRPQERKKQGFFSKLFGHDEESKAAPTPEFGDVDIEEIKRKLGLHEEDHPQMAMPDAESFLPPAHDAPKDEVIIPATREPVKTKAISIAPPEPETTIVREEELPAARVEIADWTADASEAVTVPQAKGKQPSKKAKENKSKGDQESSPWAKPALEVIAPPTSEPMRDPWDAPHVTETDNVSAGVANGDEETQPHHHEVVERHLSVIDKTQERLMAAARAARIPDIPDQVEWELQDKELHPSKYFILRNGQPVRSLKELIEVIDYIDDSTFEHHVSEYRNDFAHWIEDAIGEQGLAAEVREATDRAGIIAALRGHAQEKRAAVEVRTRKADAAARKGAQAVDKLKDLGNEADSLRAELERKTQELLGERKRAARLVKGALDKEVEHRLVTERQNLKTAVEQLKRGKELYHQKTEQLDQRERAVAEREEKLDAREVRAKSVQERIEEERKRHAAEKVEIAALQKEAARIRKEHLETQSHRERTEENLKAIAAKESQLARHEETLRQREAKVGADIARLHEELEALRKAKADHAPREAEVRKKEALAQQMVADAERRAKDALGKERDSVARVREETKKLERVRTQIDRALAKILKSKKKISSAVELRKHLEQAIIGAKGAVTAERRDLEASGYDALVHSAVATTAAGQPASESSADYGRIRDGDFTERIAQARAALERRDMDVARRLYDELRARYSQVREDAPERSALYVAIRELYDDIHLAMLG